MYKQSQCPLCGDDVSVAPDHSVSCQDCGRPVRCAEAIHSDSYPSTWYICQDCNNQDCFVPMGAN